MEAREGKSSSLGSVWRASTSMVARDSGVATSTAFHPCHSFFITAPNLPLYRPDLRGEYSHPRKSRKTGEGERDVPVEFGGLRWSPGEYVYADADGLVLAPRKLLSAP
ncbi:MAG: hypothetical protein H0V53_05585 [Rubrobacter sp.]|jgi:hypothetical protein|nr:hypothetical protein [Rubrobacter sp.]